MDLLGSFAFPFAIMAFMFVMFLTKRVNELEDKIEELQK